MDDYLLARRAAKEKDNYTQDDLAPQSVRRHPHGPRLRGPPPLGRGLLEVPTLRDAQAKVGDGRPLVRRLLPVAVAALGPVVAEPLLVKHALRLVGLGLVLVGAVFYSTILAPPTDRHAVHVHLVQELAVVALHTQTAEPVAADDRAVLFG